MKHRGLSPRQLKLAVLLAGLLVLGVALWSIAGMERTIRHGQTVLVALAPKDPRSLMQGDYMALAFALDRELPRQGHSPSLPRYAYLKLDSEGRASLGAVGDAWPAPTGQIALRLRLQNGRASIGPNAFFFQEGQGARYEPARWGEFRVSADGTALLVALRDESLRRLGEQHR